MGSPRANVMIARKARGSRTDKITASKRSGVSIDASLLPVLQKLRPVAQNHIEAHLLRLDASDRRRGGVTRGMEIR